MRIFARCSLMLLLLSCAAGPALAMPIGVSGPTLGTHAPAAPTSAVRAVAAFVGSSLTIFGITIKKDIGSITSKFVQRGQAAAGDYKTGVANAGSAWEAGAAGAEQAWEGGLQQAITAKKFTKGVTGKAGKYQANAAQLGSQRYGPGIAQAASAYQAGMAPVLATIQSVNLPPRSFRGSPQNQARSNAVSTALAAMRANH